MLKFAQQQYVSTRALSSEELDIIQNNLPPQVTDHDNPAVIALFRRLAETNHNDALAMVHALGEERLKAIARKVCENAYAFLEHQGATEGTNWRYIVEMSQINGREMDMLYRTLPTACYQSIENGETWTVTQEKSVGNELLFVELLLDNAGMDGGGITPGTKLDPNVVIDNYHTHKETMIANLVPVVIEKLSMVISKLFTESFEKGYDDKQVMDHIASLYRTTTTSSARPNPRN